MRNILIGFVLGGVLVGGAGYVLAQNPTLDRFRQQQILENTNQIRQQQQMQQMQPGGMYGAPKSPC